MSRSQPTATNPSQHFFEWKGGAGTLEFYDKTQEKRIKVPMPFTFLVLDELAKITGYSKLDKSGYYSNEVRNTTKEEFTIKIKGGVVYTGLYKSSQGIAQVPKGASYAKSVYIAHKNKAGEYILGNITMAGSALGAWIEFSKQHKVQNGTVTMDKGEVQTSPVGDFYPPVFTYRSSTPEEDSEAIALDVELQMYLSQYLTALPETTRSEDDSFDHPADEDLGKATEEEMLDYEARKADKHKPMDDEDAKAVAAYQDDVVNGFADNEPVSLDDIPF